VGFLCLRPQGDRHVFEDEEGVAVGDQALAGGLVVGVRLGLHAPEGARQFAGEGGLHEDLVAAQVEDGVDVLAVDGALLDACTAVRAVPQDLFGDDLGDQGSGDCGDALGGGRAREAHLAACGRGEARS